MINKIRIALWGILILFFLYSAYFVIVNPIHPKYEDCGEVISKSNDEVAIKHGTQTELYLNVQFRKSGFRSMEVSPTTYFHNKVGDVVCFDLYQEKSTWYTIFTFAGLCVLLVGAFAGVMGFIWFLIDPLIKD